MELEPARPIGCARESIDYARQGQVAAERLGQR
jgi:hypothetical protein